MPIARILLPILGFLSSLALPAAILAQTTPAPPASGPPAAAASPVPGAHHHHRRPFIHALRSLNLTPAQQQQVAAFRAAEKQANAGADQATKHANGAKMRGQIMGILTPDQRAQLEAQLHHHPAAPPAGAPSPAPAH